MEIVLCILTFLLGGSIGYIAGHVAAETRAALPAHEAARPDPKFLKQYQNFLNYDGTGKGQENIED